MVQKLRETILQIVPRWLRNGDAAKVLYTIGLHADAFADWVTLAVRTRYPGAPNTDTDALPTIARDRKIIPGPRESTTQLAWRLQKWLSHHKVRGNAYALLAALHSYLQDWVRITAAASANILGAGDLVVANPTYEEGTWWILQLMQETGTTHTAPTGWTLLRVQTLSSGGHHYVYGRPAAIVVPNTTTITVPSGNRSIARIYTLQGQFDPTKSAEQIVVRQDITGSGTTVTAPAVSAPVVRLALVGYDSGGTINAFPGVGAASWTEVAAEAVAGSAALGVGISAQRAAPDIETTGGATLSDTAAWGLVVLELHPSAGTAIRSELIYRNGLRYSKALSGAVTRDHVTWLGSPYVAKNGWASWWLVLHPEVSIPTDGNWDDPGNWDDGGFWDTSLTPAQLADFKLVPNAENAGHAVGLLVLLPVGAEIADYAAHPSAPIWEKPDACSAAGIVLLPITPGAKL